MDIIDCYVLHKETVTKQILFLFNDDNKYIDICNQDLFNT